MRITHKVGLIALLAVLGTPAATVEAQTHAQIVIQSAYDEGYRAGMRIGEDHGRRGQAFNFGVAVEYRQGDAGWRPTYGDHDQYRADFRVGFERGYREGYGRFTNVRQAPARSTGGRADLAFTNGYNDGLTEGLNDGRRHHRNDPYAESLYRSGDHGFAGWYGDRNTYRLNYREAFRRGYEHGYSEGWRR